MLRTWCTCSFAGLCFGSAGLHKEGPSGRCSCPCYVVQQCSSWAHGPSLPSRDSAQHVAGCRGA